MTKIKICGLFRPCDIEAVNTAGPDYCGFIINFPKSHRNVSADTVRILRAELAESITPVGVFVNRSVEEMATLLNDGTISIAQLHGQEDEACIAALRDATGGKPVWKAFKIRSEADVAAARASSADMVILDNGYGTGQAFDWTLAGGIDRPFMLAGGLTPENISDAIALLHPYGIDVSSGVETDKKKDSLKILAAVQAAGR